MTMSLNALYNDVCLSLPRSNPKYEFTLYNATMKMTLNALYNDVYLSLHYNNPKYEFNIVAIEVTKILKKLPMHVQGMVLFERILDNAK